MSVMVSSRWGPGWGGRGDIIESWCHPGGDLGGGGLLSHPGGGLGGRDGVLGGGGGGGRQDHAVMMLSRGKDKVTIVSGTC